MKKEHAPSVANAHEQGPMQGVGSGTMVRRLGTALRKNAWALFLGGALSAAGWEWYMWQFYAVLIPIALLHAWGRDA